nr:GHKL domain-containing protein [Bacteroidota bacterium]
MIYKRFTLFAILRLALILINMIGISMIYLSLERDQLVFTFIVLIVLLSVQIYNLIRYVNSTNRMLASFIMAIRHHDFSINFSRGNPKSSLFELFAAFNEIITAFKNVRIEKEVQYQFLHRIVDLISIGIIVVNKNHQVIIMNSEAERLLKVKKPGKWDQLKSKCSGFTNAVDSINESGRTLFEPGNDLSFNLAIQKAYTILFNDLHVIITFQNIKSEIEKKETEAWIKLIRTLNHEIMNSVTPISSLTETILMILENPDQTPKEMNQLDQHNINDVIGSVKTIQNRSNNLYAFVNEYRKLTKIPAPRKETFLIRPFLEDIEQFMHAEFKKQNITFSLSVKPDNLTLSADPGLIEQVLINLIKNAIEALNQSDSAIIHLIAFVNDDYKLIIEVKDNGTGIEPALMDEIFVPFFSTKAEGSGIGLSLSRQIMRLHGGTIRVSSQPGVVTSFRLQF